MTPDSPAPAPMHHAPTSATGTRAELYAELEQGVCGTAAARRSTVIVPDVHAFAGHIACDAASNSEIVVPLLAAQRLIGVLDLDSPRLARFDAEDARGLEAFAARLVAATDL